MPDKPSTVGPWTLGKELGYGGNAIVWEATRRELPDPVALKVIKATKGQRESYRRFVQEVNFLRSSRDEPGVKRRGRPDAGEGRRGVAREAARGA